MLIRKTFNLPKKGLKEPMEKLFYIMNAENHINRSFLRNMALYAERYLNRDENQKWIRNDELTEKIW